MIRSIFTLFIAIVMVNVSIAQIDISEARTMSIGSTVSIQGLVTNGGELGPIRYMQDATAGIAVYDASGFGSDTERGDLVELTGVLKEYNGLLEIDPVTSYNIISSDNALPTAEILTPNQVVEEKEGLLVRFEDVSFTDGGTTISSNNTYDFTSNGEEFRIFVRSGSPLIGEILPIFKVSLIGLISEYRGTYQLLLRDNDDIIPETNFFIEQLPQQTDITTSSFNVSWTTNADASSILVYGSDENFGERIEMNNSTTSHEIVLDNLDPASFYYVKAISSNGVEESESPVYVYSTASNSSGEIKVYFNHDVKDSFSNGSVPSGTTGSELSAAFIALINDAKTSIDVAAYNINRTEITRALNDAHNRGVVVRYIHDNETLNSALESGIDFATYNDGASPDGGLMHHKFMIVDVDNVDECYLWTGSTNLTDGNVGRDYNNSILFQDQAIAKAYKVEFEEMWGSDTDSPGFFASKFGSAKKNNTPHQFLVGGSLVEVYFSPSDNTAFAIEKSVRSADDQLMVAMLTFTYNALGSAVIDEHFEGTEVRVLLENGTDQGSEYDYLKDRGVEIYLENSGSQLHHKYAIVDPNNSDPQVVTGSHNWTNSGETRNDENTVIVHNADIANLYQQEFEKRWAEIVTGLPFVENFDGIEIEMGPIPAVNYLDVVISSNRSVVLVTRVFDSRGRSISNSNFTEELTNRIDLSKESSGIFYVLFSDGVNSTVKQFVKI